MTEYVIVNKQNLIFAFFSTIELAEDALIEYNECEESFRIQEIIKK